MALGSGMWYNTRVLPRCDNSREHGQPIREVIMSSIPRFYVYILARPNGTPFYIGKGSGRRVFDHDNEARSGHKCYKCNVIRKIWRGGSEVQRYTVFTTDDEDEAYAYEAELIALHGRGNLTNGTDGGAGGRGCATSPEVRALRRELRKADWADPRYRAKMVAMSQELMSDPDRRAQLVASSRAWAQSVEGREHLRQHNERRWSDPAQHQKLREQNARRWEDPAQRAALAARNRTPEARAKLSETRKAQWADPEYRAKMVLARNQRKNKL